MSGMNRDNMRSTIEAHLNIAARMQMKVDMMDKLGEDEYEVGAVISFDKVFSRTVDGTTYSYVAVKAPNNYWYVTGMTSSKARSWEELVEWMTAEGTITGLWICTGWASLL